MADQTTDPIDAARLRTARTIDTLIGLRRINVSELARRCDIPRDRIRHYVSGRTPVDVGVLEVIAAGLNVPAPVLLMEPEAAARWVLDNPAVTSRLAATPISGEGTPGGRLALVTRAMIYTPQRSASARVSAA